MLQCLFCKKKIKTKQGQKEISRGKSILGGGTQIVGFFKFWSMMIQLHNQATI